MTLTQYKQDCYLRGYKITECHSINADAPGMPMFYIQVSKQDTDDIEWHMSKQFDIKLYATSAHYAYLKEMIVSMDQLIINRHAQDVNTCNHHTLVVNHKIKCWNCMAFLGDQLVADLKTN